MIHGPVFGNLAQIAEVLAELGDDIERLGVTLCMDPAIATGHMSTLQTIDLIAQKQRSLASLLRAECPKSGAATIGLEELRLRLGMGYTNGPRP